MSKPVEHGILIMAAVFLVWIMIHLGVINTAPVIPAIK